MEDLPFPGHEPVAGSFNTVIGLRVLYKKKMFRVGMGTVSQYTYNSLLVP
jgi:hypothetical protein